MKAAFFYSVFYLAPAAGGWPTSSNGYSAQEARRSMLTALEQFRLADEVGFDWVTVAEHHYGFDFRDYSWIQFWPLCRSALMGCEKPSTRFTILP